MLLPEKIRPQYSIYYNGSFVLKSLQENKRQMMLDLYQNVKQKKEMTFPIFILCLDWLFLLDIVILNDDGNIELCI